MLDVREIAGLAAAGLVNLLPIAAQDAATAVDAVERLGGWAVVVWIVWWLTRRWEKVMSRHDDKLTELIDTLRGDSRER